MRVLDLFSGIGGFSLGLAMASKAFRTIAFCERDEKCQKLLNLRWPGIPVYPDIRKLNASEIQTDVVVGGYPCQPFSVAGKRRGEADDRYLWPEMLRVIKDCRPRWVIGENVAGHLSMGIDNVLSDLEAEGYACWPTIIPACAVNAPHRRDRVWIIANADGTGCKKQGLAEPTEAQYQIAERSCRRAAEPAVGRVVNGLPNRVDRLRQLGNSVVPQVVAAIGCAIIRAERKYES